MHYLYHIIFANDFTSYQILNADLEVIDECALLS